MAQSIEKFGRKGQRQQKHDCFDRPPSQRPLFWVRAHHGPLDRECPANAAPVGRQAKPLSVMCGVLDNLECVCVRHTERREPTRKRVRQLRQNGVFSSEARRIVITELIQVVGREGDSRSMVHQALRLPRRHHLG